jgi:hypothetical protein
MSCLFELDGFLGSGGELFLKFVWIFWELFRAFLTGKLSRKSLILELFWRAFSSAGFKK